MHSVTVDSYTRNIVCWTTCGLTCELFCGCILTNQIIRRNFKELKANHRKYFAICNPLFNQLPRPKNLVERYLKCIWLDLSSLKYSLPELLLAKFINPQCGLAFAHRRTGRWGEGGCSPPKFWATQIFWAARENLGKASF